MKHKKRTLHRRYGRASKSSTPSGRVEYTDDVGTVTQFTNSVLYEVGWYWQTAAEPYWVGPFNTRKRATEDMHRMSK